jgi:hypothetical protein
MPKENELTDNVESMLKDRGYTTLREVIPIECEKWEYPYRVDLIFYKDPNEATAVEFKDASLRSGGKIARAFEQIQKYRTLHYKNINIKKWCICPSFGYSDQYVDRMTFVMVSDFTQKFLNRFDICLMLIEDKEIIIDRNTPRRDEVE